MEYTSLWMLYGLHETRKQSQPENQQCEQNSAEAVGREGQREPCPGCAASFPCQLLCLERPRVLLQPLVTNVLNPHPVPGIMFRNLLFDDF